MAFFRRLCDKARVRENGSAGSPPRGKRHQRRRWQLRKQRGGHSGRHRLLGGNGGGGQAGLYEPLLLGVDALDVAVVALPLDFRIEEERLSREDVPTKKGRRRRRRRRRRRSEKFQNNEKKRIQSERSRVGGAGMSGDEEFLLEQRKYVRHDDVEGEYETVRVLLRSSLTEKWSRESNRQRDAGAQQSEQVTDDEKGALDPSANSSVRTPMLSESGNAIHKSVSDQRLQLVLREAHFSRQLRLRQVDVRGCVHCELPHRGYRPFLWDLLLRGHAASNVIAATRNPDRKIREDEKELIHLDAKRTRFGETLAAGLQGSEEASDGAIGDNHGGSSTYATSSLEKTLLGWLARLPPDAEYRQGADSLAAVVLSVVLWGRAAWLRAHNSNGDRKTISRSNSPNGDEGVTENTLSIEETLDTAVHLMDRIVADFIPGYFLRGDTSFLKTQLQRVRLVLWFWDPTLAVRLFDELEIPPAMFAVPWFITLFADVWPIERVAYVWDALFSVGPPLLTFLAVAVLRAKRDDLLRIGVGIDPETGEDYCDAETGAGAFSTCMQIFSRLNSGERDEMPNVRWCVLKALSMYAQMPRSVVAEELVYEYKDRYSQISSHVPLPGNSAGTIQSDGLRGETGLERSRSAEGSATRSITADHLDSANGDRFVSETASAKRPVFTVDIESDRRLGHFSPNRREKKKWKGVSLSSPGRGSMGDLARKLSSFSDVDEVAFTVTDELSKTPISKSEEQEGDGGRVVCRPPRVGWPDVAAWMVEESCLTVDLRNCDEASHQWLVERYMEPWQVSSMSVTGAAGGTSSHKTPGRTLSSHSSLDIGKRKGRRGMRSANNDRSRHSRSRSALDGVRKPHLPNSRRTSFLHMPFTAQNAEEAIVLVTDLIVKLRNWGPGNGFVVLVTWTDDRDELGRDVVVPVASALMRAGIPRVCSLKLDKTFAVQPQSLLAPATRSGSGGRKERSKPSSRQSGLPKGAASQSGSHRYPSESFPSNSARDSGATGVSGFVPFRKSRTDSPMMSSHAPSSRRWRKDLRRSLDNAEKPEVM